MAALFDPKVRIGTDGGNSVVSFTLSENGQRNLKKVFQNTSYTFLRDKSNTYLYGHMFADWTEREVVENAFAVTFDADDYSAFAFGIPVMVMAEGHKETHTCNFENPNAKYEYYYCATFRLTTRNTEDVRLETTVQGASMGTGTLASTDVNFIFETTSDSIAPDSVLTVSQVTEGETYDQFANTLAGTCRSYGLFQIGLQDKNGNPLSEELTQTGTLSIQVPSGFGGSQLYTMKYNSGMKSVYTVSGTKNSEGSANYLRADVTRLGYWALADAYNFDMTADTLAPGVYEVQTVIFHMIRTQTSMANAAMETPVTLVVDEDGTRTVYFGMGPGYTMGMTAYLSNLWYYEKGFTYKDNGYPEGTLKEMVVTSYHEDGAGGYLTDETTTPVSANPKTFYFELPTTDAVVPIAVRVPIMASMVESGAVQDCRFCLDYSTAKNVTRAELPTIRTAVEAAYNMVSAQLTGRDGDFTSASYNALLKAMEHVKGVYDDDNAGDEALEEAYYGLREAIIDAQLVETFAKDAGLYTADVTMTSAEEEGAGFTSGARVLRTVTAADETHEASEGWTIRMEAEGLTGFNLWDSGAGVYVPAELTADAGSGKTTVNVSVSALSTETPVLYSYETAMEGKELTGKRGYLVFDSGSFVPQTADRSDLESQISEAQTLLNQVQGSGDGYDQEKVAALQAALAQALTVCKDALALQEELDAQARAVEQAQAEVKLSDHIAELTESLASIREELNEGDYTPESWAKLSGQMDAAQALIDANADGGADAAQVSKVLKLLHAAREALVARADKAGLQTLYDEAEAIEDRGQACYDVLQTVLESTKSILDDEGAVQSEVDAQYRTLELAVVNLYGGMDASALTDMIGEIEGKMEAGETAGCSEASLDFLNAALASAKETAQNAGASQQEIDKQIELLSGVWSGLTAKSEKTDCYAGEYTIDGFMQHASQDTASMGNAALIKPMTMKVTKTEDGQAECRLYLDFQSLTIGANQGYLMEFSYFPDNGDEEMPGSGSMEAKAAVEEYYDEYDYYNDPDTGWDVNHRGQQYPKTVSLPIAWGDELLWVQVYVPVMEEINAGGGTQYAKLLLYWDSLEQVSGAADTDEAAIASKETLAEALGQTEQLLGGMMVTAAAEAEGARDAVYTEKQAQMLNAAYAYGQNVYENKNVTAQIVDAAVNALQKALAVFSGETAEADKSGLEEVIARAEELLADTNIVWEPAGKQYLELMLAHAKRVLTSSQAVPGQVNAWVSGMTMAADNLQKRSDKTELLKALEAAKTYLEATELYCLYNGVKTLALRRNL